MKIITLAAQKGGVGKTTLAVNLAVAAGLAGIKTALADLDPQESATDWADRREAAEPHIEPLTVAKLPAWLEAARGADYALAIIDTPPNAAIEALEAIKAADLVLIPCRPNLIEITAIRRTTRLVTAAEKPAYVVLNAAPVAARTILTAAHQIITSRGSAVAPAIIRQRAAWQHSWTAAQGVAEYESGGAAAAELAQLLDFIILLTNPERKKTHG